MLHGGHLDTATWFTSEGRSEVGRGHTARTVPTLQVKRGAIEAALKRFEKKNVGQQTRAPIPPPVGGRGEASVRVFVLAAECVGDRDCRYPMRTASAKLGAV